MTAAQTIIDELAEHYQPLFASSPDGVYLWLDESHKVCSPRLAALFGRSVEEWRQAEPFLESFVAADDRPLFSWNYHHRVADLTYPATFRFHGLRADGSVFAAETDMVPIVHRGRAIALHFVRELAQ